MFKNYLKTAWRNLIKRSFTSFLMLIGLACALTFSFLIGAYIFQETQINHELKNVEKHYLIKSNWAKEGMGVDFCSLAPLAKSLHEQYPHLVENHYSYDGIGSTVKKGTHIFRESIQPGTGSVLEMFGFEMLSGDAQTALLEPFTIVITETLAEKYFSTKDVLDKTLAIESFNGEWKDFVIKGVIRNTSHNSVMNLINEEDPILMSELSLPFFNRYESFQAWQNAYTVSIVELKEGVSSEDLATPITQLVESNTSPAVHENLEVELAGLSSFHLKDKDGAVQKYLWSLAIVVAFLLVLSVVNFVNLSMGNAVNRLKEIGVRKTMGGLQNQAVMQLLFESILLSLAAFILSCILYLALSPYAGDLLGRPLLGLFELPLFFVFGFLVFSLLLGAFSGFFSALKIARISPLLSLKSQLSERPTKSQMANWLTSAQFLITFLVLGAGFVISKQLDFLQNKELGYAKEKRIFASVPRDWTPTGVQRLQTFASEFERLPGIENVSLSYEIPDGLVGLRSGIHLSTQDSLQTIFTDLLQVDEHFFETYDVPLVEGSAFVQNNQNFQVIINEKAAELLLAENPDQTLPYFIRLQSFGGDAEVVGICNDFHFKSLKEEIQPLVFVSVNNTNMYRYLTFQLGNGDIQEAIASVGAKWSELMPNAPFDFKFIDDTVQKLYITESRMVKAAKVTQGLVLFIIVLGLIGILNMTLSKRKKELGIRRVLGASQANILTLFLKKYILQLVLACLVAIPITYWFTSEWLSSYAFRIELNYLWPVAILVAVVLLISTIISFQSLRFLSKNPVDSFRD